MKSSPQQNRPDAELIHSARDGDHAAFTELVRRYEDTVFRFSYNICRDKQKAEETLQDTFINVFRKLRTFDGKSKFSTWLYTIVTNNCLMNHRRRKMALIEESLEEYDHPPSPDAGGSAHPMARWEDTPVEIVLRKEMRQILEQAIRKLPEDHRVVFVLRDMEGRSTAETAKVLGLSLEATKSRLRRARAFLRQQLHPYLSVQTGVTS